jgi:murein DD-endopeptidase MepM/ murein hydrolase activator NlpD
MSVTILAALIGLCTWLTNSPAEAPPQTAPDRFRQLLIDIRTQQISPYEAQKRFQSVMRELHYEYPADNVDSAYVQLVFPLKGKNYRDVGGKGRGFFGRHFDLFDHSIARSHPAHDIFIYDPDHNCIDDRTGTYADVVAVSKGMVIATETAWSEDMMEFKGGNYVWMYDFQTGGLWYYAHLRATYVHPGQFIEAGDKLGEVGRSGFNATANRSDTHLHLMHLAIEPDYLPRPIDHYQWLKNARTVYKTQIPFYEPPHKKVEAYFIEDKSFAPTETMFKFPVISVASVVKIDRSRRALRRIKRQ